MVFDRLLRRGSRDDSGNGDSDQRQDTTTKRRIWFHRTRAGGWILVGVASFLFGWYDKVTLVWIASLYANVVSDWGAGEAADDRQLTQLIHKLQTNQESMQQQLDRIERLLTEAG